MEHKCPDCEQLYQQIQEGKASMMPNKCFPKGGQICPFLKRIPAQRNYTPFQEFKGKES